MADEGEEVEQVKISTILKWFAQNMNPWNGVYVPLVAVGSASNVCAQTDA